MCASKPAQEAIPPSDGTWDTLDLEVQVHSLDSQLRSLDTRIAQFRLERSDVEGALKALRQRLMQQPEYEPAAVDQEVASRLAAFFLGDQQPHGYQIQAACALHAGRDVFVVQPAGRGKSLCYQLAGLMPRQPPTPSAPKPAQLMVVLSPLVALAHEQAATINAARKYACARRAARMSPALHSVMLPASTWHPLAQTNEGDDHYYDAVAMEIAAGEELESDLESTLSLSDRDTESEVELQLE